MRTNAAIPAMIAPLPLVFGFGFGFGSFDGVAMVEAAVLVGDEVVDVEERVDTWAIAKVDGVGRCTGLRMKFGLLPPFPGFWLGRRSQLHVDTFLKFII